MFRKSPPPAPAKLEADGARVEPVTVAEIEEVIAKFDANASPSMKSIIMSIFTRINLVDGSHGSRKALNALKILGLTKFRSRYELASATAPRIEEARDDGRERISVILKAVDVSLGTAKGHFGEAREEMREAFGTTDENNGESGK